MLSLHLGRSGGSRVHNDEDMLSSGQQWRFGQNFRHLHESTALYERAGIDLFDYGVFESWWSTPHACLAVGGKCLVVDRLLVIDVGPRAIIGPATIVE